MVKGMVLDGALEFDKILLERAELDGATETDEMVLEAAYAVEEKVPGSVLEAEYAVLDWADVVEGMLLGCVLDVAEMAVD